MRWVAGALLLLSSASAQAVEPTAGPGTERDEDCLVCHAGIGEEDAPKLALDSYTASAHAEEGCVGCHREILNSTIEHEEPDQDLPPVDCATCHDEARGAIAGSAHDPEAVSAALEETRTASAASSPPSCAGCHGGHDVFPAEDLRARVNRVRQSAACGECHEEHAVEATHAPSEAVKAALRSEDLDTLRELATSSEDLPAGCVDCHGAHEVFAHASEQSALHPSRQDETCGGCHRDASGDFAASAHAGAAREAGFSWRAALEGPRQEAPPTCSTCHELHGARGGPQTARFRDELVRECGTCHARLMSTYAETRHGKTTLTGGAVAAKCSDCHGAHAVLGVDDPASAVHPSRRLDTCRDCHEGAPEGYLGYWTHMDPRDREAYPLAFAVLAGVLALSGSVLLFFGLHTLLWMLRQLVEVFAGRRSRPSSGVMLRRDERGPRLLYLSTTSALLGLAVTGAPLSLARASWARPLVELLGGPDMAGLLHRVFGLALFVCAFAWLVVMRARVVPYLRDGALLDVLFGPGSLLPRGRDLRDLVAQVRWFFFLGPKPKWDRWAYWEKFDHWAMFWVVPVVGGTGLVLWFPEVVASALPGSVVNLAALVHGREALIAIGFIFGVHAFHRHLRREVFPADASVFTGLVDLEALRAERPEEVARLEASGELEERRAPAPSALRQRLARALGVLTWIVGFALLGLIAHGLITTP